MTRVLIDLEISNSGESTVICCWHIEYHSPTMNGLIGIEASFKDQPIYVPMIEGNNAGDVTLEFEPWKSMNVTTTVTPIARGAPVVGRLIALIPENRQAEFLSGRGLIRISIQDFLHREYTHEFRALAEGEPLRIQPFDKLIQKRVPKFKTQKQSRRPVFITRP